MSYPPKQHKKINGVEHKWCQCGWQPLAAFSKKTQAWDGLKSCCKDCDREVYRA